MNIAFLCTYILLFLILLSKKKIDLFLLAFFFIGLYAFPLFLGVLPGNYIIPSEEIHPLLYVHFFLLLLLILISSFLYQYLYPYPAVEIINLKKNVNAGSLQDRLFFYICLLSFIIILSEFLFVNPSIAAENKGDVLRQAGYTLVLLDTISTIMTVYSYIRIRRFIYVFTSYSCLMTVFFIFGTRSTIVISSLSIVFFIIRNNRVTIGKTFLYAFTFCFSLFVIAILKPLYGFILMGKSGILSYLIDVVVDRKFLSGFEFLMTQHIFNSVVINHYALPWWEVPSSLLCVSPVPSSYFGVKSSMFNDFFQPDLFPEVSYGMAYNFWAEGYGWLGIAGLVIFSIVLVLSMMVLQRFIDKKRESTFLPLIIIISILVVFYLHRNSLGSLLTYIRNYVYMYFLLFSISKIFYEVLIKIAHRRPRKVSQ